MQVTWLRSRANHLWLGRQPEESVSCKGSECLRLKLCGVFEVCKCFHITSSQWVDWVIKPKGMQLYNHLLLLRYAHNVTIKGTTRQSGSKEKQKTPWSWLRFAQSRALLAARPPLSSSIYSSPNSSFPPRRLVLKPATTLMWQVHISPCAWSLHSLLNIIVIYIRNSEMEGVSRL